MERFLKPPRSYFVYCVGFVGASFLGMAIGILLATWEDPAWKLQSYIMMLINPNEWGWLWLPCAGASVVVLAVLSVLKSTIDRYFRTLHEKPAVILFVTCAVTFLLSLCIAGYGASALWNA